jgi:hypothetical protein
MGVLFNDCLGGYTPVCNSCGIYLCWDISEQEYSERQEYWESWMCEKCYPKARGSWLNARIEQRRTGAYKERMF